MNKIEKAKIQLLLDKPFYGYIALSLPLKKDFTIKTACTNGKWIKYNPNFINTLTNKQTQTVLIHEIKHVMYGHMFRVKGYDFELFNIAGDYAINAEIVYDENFEEVPNMLIEYKYKGMSTEQIYSRLKRDPEQQQKDKDMRDNEGGTGDVEKAPPEMNEDEESEQIKERVTEAKKFAEKAGKMPGDLKRKVDEYLNPKVPWEKLLLSWFSEKNTDDFNWNSRDNRILDYYFPSLEDDELGKLGIIIDVSGSVQQYQYNQFVAEMNKIKKGFTFDAIMLAVNTKVTSEKYIRKNQKITFNVKGGGGTKFKPAFDRLKKERLAGIIYFTDMQSGDLYDIPKPSCDVLWINFGRKIIKAPFGKVIKIEE